MFFFQFVVMIGIFFVIPSALRPPGHIRGSDATP